MTTPIKSRIPDWADAALSRDISVLRSRGEGQDMEYKANFPENTRDLGKEIAAFASSNGGMILIGVSDDGDLIGLPGCWDSKGRDDVMQRLEGISRATVKPAIIPEARFAVEADAVVLVLSVPKGSQPLYYSNNTPYIRHLTASRPAEPHEVIEKVKDYLEQSNASPVDAASKAKSELYTELARILAEVLILADEADQRQVNPWLDQWRWSFESSASQLRHLAASQVAVEEAVDTQLKELADQLDHFANMPLFIGSGSDIRAANKQIGELASDLFAERIDPIPMTAALGAVRELIQSTARKLADLASRADDMANTRHKDLQSEASSLGHTIAQISYYDIDALQEELKAKLRKVGRMLHLTETMRVYADGGMSVREIVERVRSCSSEMENIASGLVQ